MSYWLYWTWYEHACKVWGFNFVWICVINFFKIWFLEIFYRAIRWGGAVHGVVAWCGGGVGDGVAVFQWWRWLLVAGSSRWQALQLEYGERSEVGSLHWSKITWGSVSPLLGMAAALSSDSSTAVDLWWPAMMWSGSWGLERCWARWARPFWLGKKASSRAHCGAWEATVFWSNSGEGRGLRWRDVYRWLWWVEREETGCFNWRFPRIRESLREGCARQLLKPK
jgi:hypothetical protein